jgi:drug/metabolite transporter (DMT)-like permease
MLSIAVPGLGLYAAGMKRRGVLWVISLAVLMVMCIASVCTGSPRLFVIVVTTLLILIIAMLADSCRPIEKISPKEWFGIIILTLGYILITTCLEMRFGFFAVKVVSGCREPTIVVRADERFIVDRVT